MNVINECTLHLDDEGNEIVRTKKIFRGVRCEKKIDLSYMNALVLRVSVIMQRIADVPMCAHACLAAHQSRSSIFLHAARSDLAMARQKWTGPN